MFYRMDAACMVEAPTLQQAAVLIAAHVVAIGSRLKVVGAAAAGDEPTDLIGILEIVPCDDKGNPVKP